MLQHKVVAAQNAVADLHVVPGNQQVVVQFRCPKPAGLYPFQRGAKLIGDGIPPLKTACMYEPYLNGAYGLLVTEGNTLEGQEKSLREMIKLIHANRLQIGIHSCGERTILLTAVINCNFTPIITKNFT